jgi:prepilin-type N-terminal cleavage/methylation domain-containing protein
VPGAVSADEQPDRCDEQGGDTVHEIRQPKSGGFTLVEILIVMVIVGILATVVTFAVRGIHDRGQDAACREDARVISQAAEAYFAQNSVQVLPATGLGSDRYERSVVDAGYLRQVSTYYDLRADGTAVTTGVPCN